ncbi:MAG: molybdate transport system permease protein [Clostridiales bacterium]|nr:molybdate transport system permease protein [Clostridiales bacterium]
MNFSPLIISIKVSVIATIITFFLGIIGARVVVKMKRGKGLVDGIITLPMILPPTVVGFFLLLLFGKNSPLGRLLMNFDISIVFTWVAAVIASTVVSFPLMYRTVRGAFEDVDSDMIAAARTLGLSETRIFWKIIVPNVFPSIMAGTILAFARALGEFGATIMIAGNIPGRTQTMAVAVYTAVQSGNRELAYKWVAIICTISFASMFLMNYITSRHVKKNVKRGGL